MTKNNIIKAKIIDTDQRYYKIGDKIIPKFPEEKKYPFPYTMKHIFQSVSLDGDYLNFTDNYLDNRIIPSGTREGIYTIVNWIMRDDEETEGKEEDKYYYELDTTKKVRFYIITDNNKPPIVNIKYDEKDIKKVTLIITPTTLACNKGEIKWGDGNTNSITKKDEEAFFSAEHIYERDGTYISEIVLMNVFDQKTPITKQTIVITNKSPELIPIDGLEKKYYKLNDILLPISKGGKPYSLSDDMIHYFFATSQDAKNTIMFNGSNYFETRQIKEHHIKKEGLYELITWDIKNKSFYLYKNANINFYILKIPKIPKLEVTVSDFTATLKIMPQSLACNIANIDWGDGEKIDTIAKSDTDEFFETEHKYKNKGRYNITVHTINGANLISPFANIIALIGKEIPLVKNDIIYLIDNSTFTIIKPLFGNYQLNFTQYNTSGNINISFDDEIKPGMLIYLYHIFPQLFIIESVNSNNKETNIIITDYVSGLLQGRICYNGTKEGDGYRIYNGEAGDIIPEIIADNLYNERKDSVISLVENIKNNTNLIIKVRYQNVLNILQNALIQSNVTLISYTTSIEPIIVNIKLKNQTILENINLTTERNCGEFRTKNQLKLPNVVLVAGKGEGASRETAWRGDIESSDIKRIETFVDGGLSTETNFLEKQEGNTVDWNFSLTSPYNLFSDFWVGDIINVEGKLMKITKIDYAVSSAGETCVITLGYGIQTTDKVLLKMNDGIVKNYS